VAHPRTTEIKNTAESETMGLMSNDPSSRSLLNVNTHYIPFL
jgi:hypothetical protein